MFQPLTILDISWFIVLSTLLFLLLGNLFYFLLRKLFGETYFRSVSEVLGLDKDILHKANFTIFIGIAFYLLFAQTFVNGYFFIVANYLLLAIASAYSLIYLFRKWKSHTNTRASKRLWPSAVNIAVLAVILGIIVFQRSMIVQGQYGTTLNDGVQHSYITHKILETGIYQTAFDLQVSYVFGSHTIASLPAFLLGEPTYQIALLSTVLFSFLNFFAFYSLASTLNLRKAYRYFAAIVFTLLLYASYTFVCWGGLSSGTAMYLLVCALAFSTKIFVEQVTHHKKKFLMLSILIFGPLLITYPPYMIIAVFWLILYALFTSLSIKEMLGSAKRLLLLFPALAVAFASFIGYILPTMYSFFTGLSSRPPPDWLLGQNGAANVPYDYNNMFSPIAFLDYKQFTEYLNIPLFTHVQGYFDLVFYGVMLSILVVVLSYLVRRHNHASTQRMAKLILISYGFLVLTWAFNKLTSNYGFLSLFFPVQRIIQITGIFITLQYILTILLVVEIFRAATDSLLHERRITFSSFISKIGLADFSVSRRTISRFIVVIMLFMFLISNIGVVITETTYSQQWIDSNSSVSKDDLVLLQWMNEHLPPNSTVLIQWSDGGQYVPLVTNLKTIYPLGLAPSYQEDIVYEQVLQDMSKNASNPAISQTLEKLGVDYVYVGSQHFNKSSSPYVSAATLLFSPFFQYVYGVGNASLFKFVHEPIEAYIVDDFANATYSVETWHQVQGDWRIENETYVQYNSTIGEKRMLSITGSRSWESYVIKASMKVISDGEEHQQAGLVFRYQDEDNYYCIRTRNLNEVRLSKNQNGHYDMVERKSWTGEIDKWYQIIVIVEGSRIQVFLDGEKFFDVVDTSFTQGQVGLWTWYTHAAFGQFAVLPIEES